MAVIREGRMASHKASPLLPQDPERPRETQSPGLPSSDSACAQHCRGEHCIPQILDPLVSYSPPPPSAFPWFCLGNDL